ncbi:MAG: hypothetical protein WCQ70_06935 [Lentimicrobiaceae bacterium]
MKMKIKFPIIAIIIAISTLSSYSQEINYLRPNDKNGINKFETLKVDEVPFDGLKVRIGGSFTQQYQYLEHSNTATPVMDTIGTNIYNLNKLFPISPGFNLASANLRFDIQLEDGIRVTLENYMSSRHHSEFWVKGGYIQIDKLPMFGSPEWFTKYVTVKIGHFGINYGDQQFRRSDNGNTLWNAFVGNYILDAFTTEIGGEVYVYPMDGVFVMAGLTGGLINGDTKEAYLPNGDVLKKNPSILAKAGYDKQLTDNLRFRLTGSLYTNPGTTKNTLYAGDRTGSRYFMVVEPEGTLSGGTYVASTTSTRFTSGQINPDFSKKVTAISINPFVKFKGLELFGTYEIANGSEASTKSNPEPESRKFTQMAGEVVYRFLPNEQAFIGARYNTVKGRLANYTDDISINRTQVALGWYTTKNLLLKLEYVNQVYNDFAATDYRNGAEFKGVMIEAAIGF